MREFRFLDDKRQATGLSWVEEQRWNELRQMLGLPDAPALHTQAQPQVQQEQYPQGYYAADGNWYPYPANYYGEGFDPAQGWGNAEPQQPWVQDGHYFDPNTQQWIPYEQPQWDPNQQQAQQYAGYEAYPEQQPQQWDPNQQQYAAWGYEQPQQPQFWPEQQAPEAQPAPEQQPVATYDAPAELAAELPVAPEGRPELSQDDAPAALEGDVMEVSSDDVMLLDGEGAQDTPAEPTPAFTAEAVSTFELEQAAPLAEVQPTFEAPPVEEAQPAFEVTALEESQPTFEAAPVEESQPTFEAAPVEESQPTFEAAPVAETQPTFDAVAIEETPVAEAQPTFEAAPIEELPVAEQPKPTLELIDEAPVTDAQPSLDVAVEEEAAPTFEVLSAQREQPVVENPPAESQLSRDTVPTVDLSIDDEPEREAVPPSEPEAAPVDFGRDAMATMELPAPAAAQFEPEAMIELAPEDQAPPDEQPTIELGADEQAFAAPEPELSGDAGEAVPLATNSDFAGWGTEQSGFGADLQSGTLADLAQDDSSQAQSIEVDLSGDASETVPLATNSDFIDLPQLTSTGEQWSEQLPTADPMLDPAAALQTAVESSADFLDGADPSTAGTWPQQGWDYAADELPPQGDPQQQAWSDAQSAQTWEQPAAAQPEPALDVAVDTEWETSAEAPAPAEPSVIISDDFLSAPEPEPQQLQPQLEIIEQEVELEPQELEVIEEEEPAPVLLQPRVATPASALPAVAVPMAGPGAIAVAHAGAPLPRMSAEPVPVAPAAAPPPRSSVDDLFDRAMSDLSGGGQNPSFVEGEHRVIIHTVEGQVKRGVIRDVDLFEGSIPLEQQVGFAPERIPASRVKAIFFMQTQGGRAPNASGDKVRITFNDGRQVAGFSNDYRSKDAGFFLVPADNRTNTARIFVYRSSVQSVIEG